MSKRNSNNKRGATSPKNSKNSLAALESPSPLSIPVQILNDRSVAVLEAISEYLKDYLHYSYHDIALHLNRDDRTIWTCYHRAKKKHKQLKIDHTKTLVRVPVQIFQDRTLSVLEILVEYLKDQLGYSNKQIAVLINRNNKTIWTCYNRAKAKRGEAK